MKNEWLPYGSGRLREKRKAIGVENQFHQVADIQVLLGKIAHISLSSHAMLNVEVGEKDGGIQEYEEDGWNLQPERGR